MKILILSDNFPPESKGGADRVAFALSKEFSKQYHQVYVLTTTQDKINEKLGVDFEAMKLYKFYAPDYHERWRAYLSLYNPQIAGRVEKLIKEIKPDIVHAHNIHYYLSYHCLKIAKKYSKAVFLTAHDVMLFNYGKLATHNYLKNFNYKTTWFDHLKQAKKRYNPFRNILIRRYLKYVDRIFAVSNALKQALNSNGIRNVGVIHNGIDVSAWQADGEEIEHFKKENKLNSKKVVLFGGRLGGLKGGEKIIEAMEVVTKKIPNTVLLVLGKEGEYTRKMNELACRKGVSMQFTGWISGKKLKAAYWASDVITTPSLYLDPFPTVNLEAMACKKPVVGTCFGGTPEIVKNGVTGYIVNPYSTEFFAKRIIDLLLNPQKAKKFGDAGYKIVKDYFSLEKKAKEYLLKMKGGV